MSVVVEPVLTIEKLREVLAEGHEQQALDFKRTLDLNERRDIVELVKDVAAMQAEASGGYIVVGADDHGKIVPDLTPTLAALFDEATLRAKLKKYVAEPFDVRAATHDIGGQMVVLLYIGPNPEGWCIFTADGAYEKQPGAKPTTVFRVGEVFVRRGTASVRWEDADRKRLVQQVVARQKEAWRAEFRTNLAAVDVNLSAQRLEQLPSSAVTWKLDAAGFDELVTELMRRNDDIPLIRMLSQAQTDAAELVGGDLDELKTLLDRVAGFSAIALAYERLRFFERGVDTFVKIYELGVDDHGMRRGNIDAPRLWLEIAARIYGLGGLAVRNRNWRAVRFLANRKPRGHDFGHYSNWLRHAQVMASRAEILDDKDNPGLIARTRNVVRSLAALRPDAVPDSDEILDSLCQFDALAGIVVIGERGRISSGSYYTNFARYFSRRTEPAFLLLVSNADARKTLFVGDDQLLADAIREMSYRANREGFNYNGWDGLEDETVIRFLADHPTTQDEEQ
ncbi:ATP-binding protein [Phytohabitans sp. ZYX-F-186]|uniref:ATP-binding protein n=1 Tax=Phytohabitans maris TaxID=3071409 RepID=A0ABU0Z7Q3_9ACTN|nr:ATP-binding protein [Phytohabitans sp. ZYX-F-186]MDQ7903072.1 ATP-binding protein [Phytohabitans sp. ZYX-F-186]